MFCVVRRISCDNHSFSAIRRSTTAAQQQFIKNFDKQGIQPWVVLKEPRKNPGQNLRVVNLSLFDSTVRSLAAERSAEFAISLSRDIPPRSVIAIAFEGAIEKLQKGRRWHNNIMFVSYHFTRALVALANSFFGLSGQGSRSAVQHE